MGWAAVAAAVLAVALLQMERVRLREERGEAARAQAAAQALASERDRLRAEVQALAGGSTLTRDALALLDRPGSRLVALVAQPGQDFRATAILNLAQRRGYVVSAQLAPQPGKTYQLWIIRGTAPPRPAGFLQPAPAGASAGELDPVLLAAGAPDAVAVSLEPEGGSSAPTQVLMVGKVTG